jgi:mRNA interferase MazF
MRRYVPNRGEIVWLDFSPQVGHEQAGRRPALVLSPKQYNGPSGLGLFCPIANQSKGYPFEVALPPGLKTTGAILADHIKSVDWQGRKAEYICTAPDEVVEEVLAKIATLLGPDARSLMP